jgi:hypothetical protein
MLIEFRYVGIEVLTAVVMKSCVFWDITPCSLLKNNRFFGGIYYHLQDRRKRQVRNKRESRWQAFFFHAGFLFDFLFEPDDGGDMLF